MRLHPFISPTGFLIISEECLAWSEEGGTCRWGIWSAAGDTFNVFLKT